MTIESWLEAATKDADARGLPELKPLLEALAEATRALRAADFNDVDTPGLNPPASTAAPDRHSR